MNTQLALSLLIVTSLFAAVTSQTVKLAWLCTEAPVFLGFNAGTNLGALSYSLQQIESNVDSSSLNSYTFEVRFADSDCSSKSSLGSLSDLIATGFTPDLILGPLCSAAMVSSGLLGSNLNIPTFGWISSDPSVGDKSDYSTLVRLLYPVATLGEGIQLLMRVMGWRKAFLISTEGGDYGELGRGVRDVIDAQSGSYEVVNWERNVAENPSSKTIKKIYKTVQKEARIVILSVPLGELRDWMVAATESKMHRGDYVFIYVNQQTPDQALYDTLTSADFIQADDGDNSDARKGYRNLFMLFAKMNNFTYVDDFLVQFNTSQYATTYAEDLNITRENPDFYSMFLYDSMKLYARVAQEVLDDGGDINDGAALFDKARNSVTTGGATGDIVMDDNADRIPDYWLFDMRQNNQFAIIAETQTSSSTERRRRRDTTFTREWIFSDDPIWGNGDEGISKAPPDVPKCGFDGSKCPNNTPYIITGCVLGFLLILAIVLIIIIRKIWYERKLSDMAWKISYDEVNLHLGAGGMPGSVMNLRSKSQMLRNESKMSMAANSMTEQLFITVGNYRGTNIAVKRVSKDRISVDRKLLQEMRQVELLNHTNINGFVGACLEAPNICLCWEYAMKGSLSDVIWNDTIQLDDLFKFAIVIDILKGLEYIHGSEMKVHGNLKSSNIVVDGRFQCKLTDLHLQHFTAGQQLDEELSDYAKLKGLQWTSPELLREHYSDLSALSVKRDTGSQAGDLYSAAVIVKEVFARNDPYTEFEDLDLTDILEKVMAENQDPVFRPSLDEIHSVVSNEDGDAGSKPDDSQLDGLKQFACLCWAEDPVERPTASLAIKELGKVNPYKHTSVIDNMVGMMEKYSAQLEERVAEATLELAEEKKKTEALLEKMLPKQVAEDLKRGRQVDAESFDNVTIYFSDIPGFSDFTSKYIPVQVVDLLNSVYSMMDDVINQHDVYKVETVGDVYVLAAGLPVRIGDRHVVEIVNCALDLMSGVTGLKIPSLPSYKVQLRMGIHTGPIVTGVIGLAMPRYCLFGDTINTSSRMESTGAPMRIHMSPFSKEALSKFAGYYLADRGKIPVKGKGEMNTYWVLGRKDFNKPLPNFDKLFAEDKQQATKLPVTVGKTVRITSNPLRPSVESGYSDATHGSVTSVNTHAKPGDNKGQTNLSENKGQNHLSDDKEKQHLGTNSMDKSNVGNAKQEINKDEVTLSDIKERERLVLSGNVDKMTDVKSEVTALSTIGTISPASTPGVERKNGLTKVQGM